MAARARKADDVEAQADAAASEAAHEARAEVLERAGPRKAVAKKAAVAAPAGWHNFVVDVWITKSFNVYEFGIYKRSRNRAKSRQFTADMDIFAEITENGERTGLLSYREDLWTDKTGMDKRLVFKLFSDKLTWRATMDMMIGRSLQATIGARGLPILSFSLNTDDDDTIIYLERSANKWPLLPENYSFFLVDKVGKPEFYRLKRDLIDIGGDYTLLDERDEVVGHLDGKVFSIGGKWKCRIRDNHPSIKKLSTVMKLFCAFVIFNGESRRHMKRVWRDVRSGRLTPALERQEADLYLNPRRTR